MAAGLRCHPSPIQRSYARRTALCCPAGNGFASWRSLLSALGDRVAEELDSASLYT